MLLKNVAPTLAPRRRAALWAAGAVGLLVVLWLGAFLVAGSGIARGTTVLGVDIGGMDAAQAEATLERELTDEATAPIEVTVGEDTFRLNPRRSGLAFDVAATVEQAGDRSWNPVSLVKRLTGAEEIEPVVTVDDAKLDASVGRFADRVEGEPTDGAVRFKGAGVVVVDPVEGRYLDRDAAAEAVESAYLRQEEPIELAAEITSPTVDSADVRKAVEEFAEPAMSGPVRLVVSGREAQVPPRLIGPALVMTPDEEGALEPSFKPVVLKRRLEAVTGKLEQEPKDASFRIGANGRPVVVPAKRGRTIEPKVLADAILPALTETGAARTATAELTVSDPELTTLEARDLGVDELVSEYTTFYPSDFAPRLTNIHRAADLMDNTLVMPGETFSLNDTVGERTKERGFAAGYIINKGKLEVDYGGGVSQLATTTFNAAFFAGLEDVEHHPHSFYISRYPEGREATIAWGFKDLRFRNDSGHGVFLTTSYTDGSVTVRVWGTKRYTIEAFKSDRYAVRPFETEHDPRPLGNEPGDCVPQEGVTGFQVDVTRAFFQGGSRVRSETFHTVYQPEARVVCGSTGPEENDQDPPQD